MTAMRLPASLLFASVLVLSSCSSKPAQPPAKRAEAPKQSPSKAAPKAASDDTTDRAPDKFAVALDTTKGTITIDVDRSFAPHGADRFYQLVKAGYYTDLAFFRVIPGFMAQIGLHGDPATNATWREKRIPDDPVNQSNTRGMVSFATAGPNTRTTQFFINFADNSRLDMSGFAPFGKVRDMTVVDALYSGYGEGAPRGRGPSQALIQSRGNEYLRAQFPQLDYIKSAKVVDSP